MKTKHIAYLILAVTIGIWAYFEYRPQPEPLSFDKVDADSIRKVYNAKEQAWEFSRLQYVASQSQLVAHFKGMLDEKDAKFYALAKDKKVRDVTKIDAVAKVDTTVKTDVKDSVYTSEILTEYMEARIIASKDSTSLSLQMKLPLTISKSTDGRITVSTPDPYVEITGLTGFTKVTPDRKRNWKYWVGGIIGGALVYEVVK